MQEIKALAWTIIGLFSIILAIMGWDTIRQNKKEQKKTRNKNRKR